MPIPPVGNTPGSTPPPDDKLHETRKPAKARPEKEVNEPSKLQGEKVEISPEAIRIRERQSEITRLQVAERAAGRFIEVEDRAREFVKRTVEEGNGSRSEEISRQIEKYGEDLKKAAESAKHGGENLLDGREMRFEVDNREITIRTPDARREAERITRETREYATRERDYTSERADTSTREFIDKSATIRKQLERDVRNSIAEVVKESSNGDVRDVADAERLISNTRRAGTDSQQQKSNRFESIEGKAIDLLQ